MNTNDFFITLESNADLQNHPDYTQNKFKVTLESPIELQGEWETGLAQFIFPHSWHEQIMKDKSDIDHHHHLFLIKLHVKGDAGDDMSKDGYWRDLHILPRNYQTIKDILLAIRSTTEQSKRNIVQFIYLTLGGGISGPVDMEHVRINCTQDSLLALPIELAKILSYNVALMEKEQWTQMVGISIQQLPGSTDKWCVIGTPGRDTYIPRQFLPAPLSEHITVKLIEAEKDLGLFQNIYINSDLIETQYIGNTRSNVLRIIAPVMKKGEIETFNFNPIFYLPLRVTKFNTIEINITGDTGQLVPFDGGAVITVLHLRRKHNILV